MMGNVELLSFQAAFTSRQFLLPVSRFSVRSKSLNQKNAGFCMCSVLASRADVSFKTNRSHKEERSDSCRARLFGFNFLKLDRRRVRGYPNLPSHQLALTSGLSIAFVLHCCEIHVIINLQDHQLRGTCVSDHCTRHIMDSVYNNRIECGQVIVLAQVSSGSQT